MADLVATPIVEAPTPIPVPVAKQIRALCQTCKGTGSIALTNGPLPATTTPCDQCAGTGKIVFGEVDA